MAHRSILTNPVFGRSLKITILAVSLSGCVSEELGNRLLTLQQEAATDRLDLLELNEAGGHDPLRWEDAVRLLEERNISLKRSRIRIKELERKRDEQWKNWLPSLTAHASLVTSLSSLGSLAWSDISGSLIAPLSIPDPVSERANAFANALAVVEARDAYELNRRRQTIALYRLFSRYEDILRQEANEVPSAEGGPSVEKELEEKFRDSSYEESKEMLEGSLVRLLDLPGRNPRPVPSSLPGIDYSKRIHRLKPGKNYGLLATRLTAYQIEAALLSEKGVELSSLPNYSMSGSIPALVDTTRDETVGFDSGDVRLYGGISKSYSFTGDEARRVKTAKQNTEFVKRNLRQQMDQDIREWLRLKSRYEELCQRRELSLERLERVRRSKSGGSAFGNLEQLRSARTNFERIERAKEQLELEIWMWDDKKWQ